MKQTAVEFQTEKIGILVSKLFNDEISKAEFHFQRFEICEQAKEMEKQQQEKSYNKEEVEKLIKTTYEETMRAMVDWFIHNKDKNQEEMESAIENYVYPRLSEKGIKFKNK